MAQLRPIVVNFFGKRLLFVHLNCQNIPNGNCLAASIRDVEQMEQSEIVWEMENQLTTPTFCFYHWIRRLEELVGRQLSPLEIGICDALLIDEATYRIPLPWEEVKQRIDELLQEYNNQIIRYICLLK
jgi:hypothetical protein